MRPERLVDARQWWFRSGKLISDSVAKDAGRRLKHFHYRREEERVGYVFFPPHHAKTAQCEEACQDRKIGEYPNPCRRLVTVATTRRLPGDRSGRPFLLSVDPSAAASSAGGEVCSLSALCSLSLRTGGLLPLRYASLHSTRDNCGAEKPGRTNRFYPIDSPLPGEEHGW